MAWLDVSEISVTISPEAQRSSKNLILQKEEFKRFAEKDVIYRRPSPVMRAEWLRDVTNFIILKLSSVFVKGGGNRSSSSRSKFKNSPLFVDIIIDDECLMAVG